MCCCGSEPASCSSRRQSLPSSSARRSRYSPPPCRQDCRRIRSRWRCGLRSRCLSPMRCSLPCPRERPARRASSSASLPRRSSSRWSPASPTSMSTSSAPRRLCCYSVPGHSPSLRGDGCWWMSRLLGLVIAASLLASPLRGQDSLMVRRRKQADSLLGSWREAQKLADVADSLEQVRATVGADTIAVGGLRIVVNPSPLPWRQAAELAWPVIDSLYGSVAADLPQHPYIFRAVDPDSNVRRTVLHVGVEVPSDLDVRATTNLLLTTVSPPSFDPALADWLAAALRPTLRPQDERAAVFVQLVTAPSEAVRRCFLGDIARCKDVLQLGDSTGLLARWYVTPAEREALVTESFSDYFARGGTGPSLQRCRQHHDDACTALLQSLPPGTLPRPLAQAAGILLVREALRAGGRDAYRRLVARPSAPIGERLASAAGGGIDSLGGRGGDAAAGAAPQPLTPAWWGSFAAIGWATLFGFCSLRGSRWRLL